LTDPAKPTLLQALADRRMTAILLLGFASGLPFNLTGSTLQAWLASDGIDIKSIGIFSLVTFPYVFKWLWAPLLDRYLPPLLGRRRGWILLCQIALALAIAVMGWNSPTRAPYLLGFAAVLVAFLSASQDIVIDAYRVDVIPSSERGLAAAATAFGYKSAAMFAGAFTLLLADYLGWRTAYGLVALVMALTVVATLLSPEPTTPGRPPATLTAAVIEPLRELLSKRGAWGFLLLILLYKIGDAFALSLYSAFMIKGVGFSTTQLAIGGKINMTISTMIGTALGGWAYLRWGLFRSMLIFGIAQALTNLLYMWLALAGKKLWLMVLATSVDNLAGGMGAAAFTAFVMAQCSVNFSAFQYALLSALAAIPRWTIGALAGQVVSVIGWAKFFVVTFATAMPGLALLIVLRASILELDRRRPGNATT
jgi:MFS transporter, PAT family, beta-lactamase induction signal transducer AmpG